jgi:hypothetical protein
VVTAPVPVAPATVIKFWSADNEDERGTRDEAVAGDYPGLAVIGDIEGRLLIPQAASNIALEGSVTPESAAKGLQEQVEPILAGQTSK